MHPLTADPATVRGDRGLAYTLDPRVLYRGYFANTLNMGLGTGFQFLVNGSVKQMMTGSEHRQLSPSEQLSAGFVAGSTSALLISPTELLMIQQQRKGGGIIGAAGIVLGTSPATALRGMLTTGNSSSARPSSLPPHIMRMETLPFRSFANARASLRSSHTRSVDSIVWG